MLKKGGYLINKLPAFSIQFFQKHKSQTVKKCTVWDLCFIFSKPLFIRALPNAYNGLLQIYQWYYNMHPVPSHPGQYIQKYYL